MIYKYNRNNAVDYAVKWALSRNPAYYNYDNVGGDCTSYVSQCIYNGCKVMNYSSNLKGWYYIDGNNKSPSWTSVESLYYFLVNNKGIGPFGKLSNINEIEIGDVIQLKFKDKPIFSHSLIISKINERDLNNIFVCSHTLDTLNKIVGNYIFEDIRFIHIQGFRK